MLGHQLIDRAHQMEQKAITEFIFFVSLPRYEIIQKLKNISFFILILVLKVHNNKPDKLD